MGCVIDNAWVIEIPNYTFGIVLREHFAQFNCYNNKEKLLKKKLKKKKNLNYQNCKFHKLAAINVLMYIP
jgi:hypothetical protein